MKSTPLSHFGMPPSVQICGFDVPWCHVSESAG